MKIESYPNIAGLGHRLLQDLLLDPVVIQEKVDGSQFSVMREDDETFYARSKEQEVSDKGMNSLFKRAYDALKELDLIPGFIYRGEVLDRPKHNTLKYDRTPKCNFILYDVESSDGVFFNPQLLLGEAERLDIECVPLVYEGIISNLKQLDEMLNRKSILGDVPIEGIVIKNYHRRNPDGKVLMGKLVSAKFKELHIKNYKSPGLRDVLVELINMFTTPARWQKAIQHLAERDELKHSPEDIGPLVREIQADVFKEEIDVIKDFLFNFHKKDIERGLVRGFPEWYKRKLMEDQEVASEPSLGVYPLNFPEKQ
jgi:RNA ligase